MERQVTMKLALGLYRGSWGLGFPKKAGLLLGHRDCTCGLESLGFKAYRLLNLKP